MVCGDGSAVGIFDTQVSWDIADGESLSAGYWDGEEEEGKKDNAETQSALRSAEDTEETWGISGVMSGVTATKRIENGQRTSSGGYVL
jgi:hypothetical protein